MSEAQPSSTSHASKPASKKAVNLPSPSPGLNPRSGKSQSSAAADAPALVLVVDDQPRNLQIVKKALTYDGYHVVTAESGQEALKCISSRWPDLILLDVVMPEMDGFEVCELIKGNPATQNIPIIFLSGDTEHQSVMTGFAKGGVDYISKPFNKSELLARVRTHVELHRSQVRNARQVQERQRTLDIIAHEWHKPLQRISLFLSTVHQDIENTDQPGDMSALSKEALRETDRMLSSIEDFLHQQSSLAVDGFQEATAPMGLTTDDIKSMVGKWYVTAKRKLVELVLSAPAHPLPVAGLSFAVNQIVDAVLSNAVNFTPQAGRIEVRIIAENGQIVLRVKDNGPGFSDEYLRRQFQPFMSNQKDGKKAATLGVGLAAAKRIADRINATFTLGNRTRGSGGYVKITFPAPTLKKVAIAPAPQAPATTPKTRRSSAVVAASKAS